MKFTLLAILISASVLADHQGLPHNIAEDEAALVQEENDDDHDDLADAIYEAILDEYYLPWEVETEEVPDEVLIPTTEVDPEFVFYQGEDVIIDDQGNAYASSNSSSLQNNFAMMLFDANMCAVELIYKYNLTDAVKDTKNIVVEETWIHNLKAAQNETKVREIVADAITPLTMQLMMANGSQLVDTMPDEVVNWIAETAIVWASNNNVTDDNATEWFFQDPEACPETEIVYEQVIVEKEVYTLMECPSVDCDPCPVVDCPVPEACPIYECQPVPDVVCEFTLADCEITETLIYEYIEAECAECEACVDFCIEQETAIIEPLEDIQANAENDGFSSSWFANDDEYYEETSEDTDYNSSYECDELDEDCREGKYDRSTDTYDENYNMFYDKEYVYYSYVDEYYYYYNDPDYGNGYYYYDYSYYYYDYYYYYYYYYSYDYYNYYYYDYYDYVYYYYSYYYYDYDYYSYWYDYDYYYYYYYYDYYDYYDYWYSYYYYYY